MPANRVPLLSALLSTQPNEQHRLGRHGQLDPSTAAQGKGAADQPILSPVTDKSAANPTKQNMQNG